MRPLRHALPLACAALLAALAGAADDPPKPFVPTDAYETRALRGWRVRVNKRLLNEDRALGDRAIALLIEKLDDIAIAVPPRALARLREIPIWLGVDDGHAPCAEYHPSRVWLATNGYNPDKAKSVEIGNAARFVEWSQTQPSMVLHELAHGYHDRMPPAASKQVQAAFVRATQSGAYAKVRHINGNEERHYALTNPQEFFAELSESYFGLNDFEPFVRDSLESFDPESARVIRTLWHSAGSG